MRLIDQIWKNECDLRDHEYDIIVRCRCKVC